MMEHSSACQRVLVATDAIGAVRLAQGDRFLQQLLVALDRLLAVADLQDGGIYLYHEQPDALALVAARSWDGLVARQGTLLVLRDNSQLIPARAALARRPEAAALSDARSESAPLWTVAWPLLVGERLIGVLQLAGGSIDPGSQDLLRELAARLAAAIDNAQAAAQTRAEPGRMRALLDASNDAILMLDRHGAATMINRRAKYFFGLAERDVVGRSPDQMRAMFRLIFEDADAFEIWLAPLLASAEDRSVIELKVLRAEPRLLQCFSAPVRDNHEHLLGRMLVFRDITREREVDRMKNEFVSIVSHELRTPLTSIRGSLQLVLGRPQQPELSPRTRELLDISLKNSERLIRLINDILDISKIEQGSIQLRLVSLDPADLCRTAMQEVETLAAARGITLGLAVPEGLPPISADRDRALQIIANLLSNAIKFSEPNQRVELSAEPYGGAICFSVRDYGRGIAPEDHQRIFEKFHQADSSLTRNVGGTGLGLAICKALVEEHKGRIWVESGLGRGATLSFTLPLASGTEPVVASRADSNQPTILVVDDSGSARNLIRTILEGVGYQVAEASRGAEAIQLARLLQPQLMTLDVMMPDIDGFDVLQLLRSDPITRDLPVLFVSAGPERERGMIAGGAGFVAKPFTTEELLSRVRQLVLPARRHVLVVDDDYHVRPTLARLLQRGGFSVAEASDGRTGLEQIERDPPDLVLLDLRMPDIDGYEMLRRLKRHPVHQRIPVVVLTASDLDGDAERRVLDLGAVRYLEKPIASEDLLAEIERVLA